MASMTSDVRNAMRDLLADIVGIKHDVQTAITAASLRKATLAQSETSVRDDITVILTKLQATLKLVADKAIKAVGNSMVLERDKINTDILFLEDQHKRLEESEEEVRSKTSNISMKVMKDGRDVCESAREAFEQYKNAIAQKKLQFVLHSFLATILEQIETFSMGEVKVVEVTDDHDEMKKSLRGNKYTGSSIKRSQSVDPSKTSFSRSNSQDPIKTSFVRSKSSQILRTQQESRSMSRTSIAAKGLESRRASVSQSTKPNTATKRTRNNSKKSDGRSGNSQVPDSLKSIAGLQATVVNRSLSEPLLNLISKEQGVFMKDKNLSPESLHPEIAYKELLHTKQHNGACYITGISVLPNKNVVVCDSVHDSLQLYNPDSQIISELQCDHPWAVTMVSDSAVAVTLHYNHKVILVKATERLEQIQDKEIKLKCESSLIYDIKHYEYRLYVLCINGDVHVMDIKGREYKTIRTGMLPNVLKFFDIDMNRKRLIVSGDNGVLCVNFEGLYQWSYRPKNKFVSTGIVVVNGQVLVCDWENHCVTQIYDEGKKATTVLAESLEKPVVISVDPDGRNYFFSQGDYDMDVGKTRVIKVFELV